MLELIVGIILGAAFPDFWRKIYRFGRRKVSGWLRDDEKNDFNDRRYTQ